MFLNNAKYWSTKLSIYSPYYIVKKPGVPQPILFSLYYTHSRLLPLHKVEG